MDREELRQDRLAKNEQAARAYNNRRLQFELGAETDEDEDVPFLCEYGDGYWVVEKRPSAMASAE